jgi:hypothetical protein
MKYLERRLKEIEIEYNENNNIAIVKYNTNSKDEPPRPLLNIGY